MLGIRLTALVEVRLSVFVDKETLFGMYSCVTADAPHKCHQASVPNVQPPELSTGFVKIQRIDERLIKEITGEISEATASLAPRPDEVPPAPEEFCSAAVSSSINEAGTAAPSVLRGCTLQRLSDHIYRVGDLQVDVQQLRFTQNTISSYFRDGRSVKQLAEELRSNPSRAQALPKLQVFAHAGRLHSLDNRRLFAMKVAGIRHVLAEQVQVRRDMLNKRMTTTSAGRVVVFQDEPSIPDIVDFKVFVDECSGSAPNCLHRVEVTQMGSENPSFEMMSACDIVRLQARSRLPIDDHFEPAFMAVMCGMAYPKPATASAGGRKARKKKNNS